jgi:hypothetical protein
MSVGRPMGPLVSPCSHNQEGSAVQPSGSKETPCHLGLTQASDPMQKLQHPGRYGKNRILQPCRRRAVVEWSDAFVINFRFSPHARYH